MAQPRPQPKRQTIEAKLASLKRFVLSNLIASVCAALVACWVVVSWLVYRAEFKAEGSNITSFADSIWWGIVTLLTVGYGDRYPVTTEGRVYAGILMFAGVLAIAIITSKISSRFLEQALREGKGIVNEAKLRDHLIVCGWKEEMHALLAHILDFNVGLEPEQLVLIGHLTPAMVESLRAHSRLKRMQFVIGNYFEVENLRRAFPERARKVIILADRTPGPNGQVASMTEVDARTIMTAMSLASIARGTLVAAEIIDPKMDQYLKLASVGEIIYTRECSRLLLGNAAGGTGVANIIYDLLDPSHPTLITTYPVPEATDCAYGEFRAKWESARPGSIVIGVLENTGNLQSIKERALRQAQKTPDVSKLLANLRSVKELRCNHPVFNPAPDYPVRDGAMVIVVETREGALSSAHGGDADAA